MTTGDADHAPVPVRPLRAKVETLLAQAGVPTPDVDAELLIGHVLDLSRGAVQARIIANSAIERADAERVIALARRRATREPLQHITGRAAFRSLELFVGPGVFTPRPETELIAGIAVDALLSDPSAEPIGVDLGTGSGAIALSMTVEVPHARVYAVELSPEAHVWARRNIDAFGDGRTALVQGDLADALPELDGSVSVVASNPPYVPTTTPPVDPEVARFDPDLALYGGETGLDVIPALSRTALRLLRPGGLLVIEHAEHQSEPIAGVLAHDGWRAIAHHRDLTGRDRATTAIR